MAVNSVDMSRALESSAYAQQVCRSGQLTADQKGQLVAKWGNESISKWMSVDGTEYEIDDVSYDAAKNAGRNAAAESTGHDGSKGSTFGAVSSAVGGAAVVFGAVAPSLMGKGVANSVNWVSTKLGGDNRILGGSKETEKNLGAHATVILAAAVAAKYWASNHNKDQYEAAMKMMETEFPQGEASLYEAQNNMADATDEVTALTEEAEATNEDANDKIEEDKALFDFYREQFLAIKEKQANGVPLTEDEKALVKQLQTLMEELGVGIEETTEETTDSVDELYDNIGEYQDAYDEAGETIAEVEGMTDFAEGFDEATRTLCYVEGAGQTLNAAGATRAAAQLSAGGFWNWAFAAIGYAAAASSGIAAGQQFSWAGGLSQEIDARRSVQELGLDTTDIYGEELDNFAGNMEVVEDLELEIPEDMEVPEDTVATSPDGSTGLDPLAAGAAGVKPNEDDKNNNNPASSLLAGANSNGNTGNTTPTGNANNPAQLSNSGNENKDDDKKKPDEKV